MFQTRIRRNIRLAEAPSFGQSIFAYAPDSNGAEDYQQLAQEVLASTLAQRRAG
jgi:chromosome partitioning protein